VEDFNEPQGRAIDRPRRIEPFVLVAGLALTVLSTAFAAYSTWLSHQALLLSQQSTLLSKRVDACAELDRLTRRHVELARASAATPPATVASTAVNEGVEAPNTRASIAETTGLEGEKQQQVASERLRIIEALHSDRKELEKVALFDLLGPEPLAVAEADLLYALANLDGAVVNTHGDYNFPEYVSASESAGAAQARFRDACTSGVGVFRLSNGVE
jgi:hypothetical protein